MIPSSETSLSKSGEKNRQRTTGVSISEIMTIVIASLTYNHRALRLFITGVRETFGSTRFIEVMPRTFALLAAFFEHINGQQTSMEFIKSTSLKVCHNIRISRHNVFENIPKRSKSTMGSLSGLKIHLIVNHLSEIIETKVTTPARSPYVGVI
tara:strand:- start:842 stop:1300 length:459 start_codon:yes stop_codon:yes gene_type:complete